LGGRPADSTIDHPGERPTSPSLNHPGTLRQGFFAALPVIAGYIVLGIPCGILGAQAKMSAFQVTLMSLLFYSGAGQYMIPNMWMAGSPIASIVLGVSLINSRQILYAASLSRFLEGSNRRLSLLFSATVTDESFGVNLERFMSARGWDVRRATVVNLCSWLSWVCATLLGALVGTLFSVPAALASFAMTSIFICLLFMQKPSLGNVVAASVAAISLLICKLLGFSGPAILIGALAGIAFALLAEHLREGGKAR
jgi:4-azaleucine resistance transporter AzlC